MKIKISKLIAGAVLIAFCSPSLHAQEASATEDAGLSFGQALELARIVNATSTDQAADVIDTVVKDVMANAADPNVVAGQITAALVAAIVEKQQPRRNEEVAQVVSSVAGSASGDAAAALAERSAATVAAVSAMTAFKDFVDKAFAEAAADAASDPLSVLTVRDAAAYKALYESVLRALTPEHYIPPTDTDALFIPAPPSGSGVQRSSHGVSRPSPTPVGRR